MTFITILIIAAYFAPTIYLLQKKPAIGRLVFVATANLILGWSIIGWFLVARMACTAPNKGSSSLPRYTKEQA